MKNKTLIELNLNDNKIGNSVVKSLAQCICVNESLEELCISDNKIDYEGELVLLDAVRHNSILITLQLTDEVLENEFEEITQWNYEVKDNSSHETKFPWSYRDHMIHILMILNQFPLCSDLNWIIITMLRVKDIVGYRITSV